MNLIGCWVIDSADQNALAALGNVVLDFAEDGHLTYTVRGEGKSQVVDLRYRIEGTTIVTDQPSAPRAERTGFSFSEDGALTLLFDGVPYRFHRP